MCVLSHLSHVRIFATVLTVAYQAPLSMGFSRQEYWSGVPLPSLIKEPEKKSNIKYEEVHRTHN